MKLKKLTKILAVFGLTVVALVFVVSLLANRDLVRMYGGLTEPVDTEQFEPLAGSFAVDNVSILSLDGEGFIPGQTVYIEDGLIVAIDTVPERPGRFQTIDGEGKYLIPGLVDSHVHLFKSPNDLLLYVANGVTHIRELIGEQDHLAWRQEVRDGRLGPDMFIASPRLGSFGSVEGMFMSWSQGYVNLKDAEAAEELANEMHRQGYDAVKIYSQISRESYQAVATTARSLGMKVVGHVPWSLELADIYPIQDEVAHLEELMNALNREFGGFSSDTAEEFLAFVERRSDQVASDLLQNEIVVTTTLWLVESFVRQKFSLDDVLTEVELEYENPGISEWSATAPRGLGWLPGVNRYSMPEGLTDDQKERQKKYWETYAKACRVILGVLSKRGVSILAGTDANLPPTVPGFSLHDEFVSLTRAGMTPAQVLRSATSIPSDWLNSNTGRISVGRQADLVLLDENPLSDISNTRTINSVFLDGRLLDRALLDRILAGVREANDSSRKQEIDRYLTQGN